MKWNWGTGIFIFIVIFLCACFAFIYFTQTLKWSLVEEDYYPKELRHEEKLVKMRNANALTNPLTISVDSTNLVLQFPDDFTGKTLKGSIHIYRPSDEALDLTVPVATGSSCTQVVPLGGRTKGRYIVKVDWTAAGVDYYQEQDIYLH